MRLRFGLQARFLLMVGVALLVVLALVALLWARQAQMQQSVEQLSRGTINEMVDANLRRRAEGVVGQLAGSLSNHLYYFDLDAIGHLARATLRQPGTSYVIVYDGSGNILHDGTEEIPSYGKRMDDAMAVEAVAARGLYVQASHNTMDVSAPVMLGDARLGGVRVGFDRLDAQRYQDDAIDQLRANLADLGRRQSLWVILLGLSLLLVGAVMLVLIQRKLVRPIRRLADAAREIEAGNFGVAFPASERQDELGDLVRAFGRMSQSVARHDREIRRMAYTDALTGLSNRHAFRELLDARLLQLHGAGRQLALLFADIDDFKRVNDTLGHDVGDEVLLQFAHRIREVVQGCGSDETHLARFGGDEFVILVQGADVRRLATDLAEALVAALREPIVMHGRQVFLGSSIGVTLFPDDAVGATALLKNGDIAMYQAKLAGKSCYRFYSRAIDQAVERRVHLEQELRGAWARGELTLVYQPIFRLDDGVLTGAEALLRWQHRDQGSIAPSVFIDVAEQSGLIEAIGAHVLRAACADAVRWESVRSPGAVPLFISVNVSPRQLRSGDFARMVLACLGDSGLAPQRLHLELTETAVIGDEPHVGQLLAHLRQLGVKVWLDDFGTGFSGLSHLRRVPVDGVKIDRSFVADVLRDPDDLALTTAIIAMAHSLGITVVAEGVEKEGHYDILRERGCDLAQGYWLGHPMTYDDFVALLRPESVERVL